MATQGFAPVETGSSSAPLQVPVPGRPADRPQASAGGRVSTGAGSGGRPGRAAPEGGVVSGDEPDAQKLAEARRARRRCAVADLAVQQHGVVSLRELYDVGLTRSEVRAEVRAGCGARVRHRGSSVDVRQSRRWSAADVQPGSRPARTRTPVAAVRAGLWAASDRQAALVLTMAVQQRLVTADQLGAELLRVRRDKRRLLLHQVVLDLVGGVQSLGELDVVRGCRQPGLGGRDRRLRSRTSYEVVVRATGSDDVALTSRRARRPPPP